MGAPGWYPGRCNDCARKATHGVRCGDCREQHRKRSAARRKRLKREGRCTVCARKAITVHGVTLTVCGIHREYYRARAAAA